MIIKARGAPFGHVLPVYPPIEPYRVKMVEPIPFPPLREREAALAAAGYNVFRLPSDKVTIDLLTDSGTGAMSAAQWGQVLQGDESYAGARSFARLEAAVQELTGYPHVIPTHQGRAAERLLFEELVEPGHIVPGNAHFDTTRANLAARGARPVDLPSPATRRPMVAAPFKGDIDLDALAALLSTSARRIPMVILTVTANSAGGQPVSLPNARLAAALCREHGVPLFLDAARFAENAWLCGERDPALQGRPPREIARAFFDLADGCLVSGKKDGLVNIGGFLALRDGALAKRVRQRMVLSEGFPTYGGLAGRDLEALAQGLEEVLEPAYLADRIGQVRHLGDTLHDAGVPTVRPPGGHAVYIDARAFAPHIDPLGFPGQSLVCELYRSAGVRACEVGQLMFGAPGADGREAPVPLDLVRLAIPRRVYSRRQLDYVAAAVASLLVHRDRLRPLELVDQSACLRHFSARLRYRDEAVGRVAAEKP